MSSSSEAPAAAPAMTARSPYGIIAFLLMLTIIAVFGISLSFWTFTRVKPEIGVKKHEPLRILGEVPPFALTASDGSAVTRETFAEAIWIADFIFTRCGGTCPAMTRSMHAVQKSLAANTQLWPPVRLASISVDPEWDTQERLRDYAARVGADPRTWVFLTGDYDAIQDLARDGFKIGVEEGSEDANEPIIHSQSLVLVDPAGRIRGYYDGTDPEAVRILLADVMRLSREISKERS